LILNRLLLPGDIRAVILWVREQIMTPSGADFPIERIASDEAPAAEQLVRVRAVYARTFADLDITPLPGSSFAWCGALRRLPGLAIASTSCSAVRIVRGRALGDDEELILTATIAGRATLRHGGRTAELAPGEVALTRGRDATVAELDAQTRWIVLRIPLRLVAPAISDIDAILVSAVAAPEPLSMLLHYVDDLLASNGLERPETLNLAVAHVHEIIALILDAAQTGKGVEKGRGPGALRLRAIKADIVENVCSRELTIISIAERHRVTPRYVRKLFEGEGMTFSEFVLAQRLARARRMLTDPRSGEETISAIAFACGFGDLSYFNRVFRRLYGATPTAVRDTRGGAAASVGEQAGRITGVECGAAGR
jgi:AraC-like DNA-binding protein